MNNLIINDKINSINITFKTRGSGEPVSLT